MPRDSRSEGLFETGAVDSEERANQICKQLLGETEQPPVDPGIDAALRDYATRRRLAPNRAGD